MTHPTIPQQAAKSAGGTAREQPMILQLLDTYKRNLEELIGQVARIRSFCDRVDGAKPPNEATAKAEPPSSTLSKFEHLNMDLRDIVSALTEEAERLERIS